MTERMLTVTIENPYERVTKTGVVTQCPSGGAYGIIAMTLENGERYRTEGRIVE